jgi:hypothetical protein
VDFAFDGFGLPAGVAELAEVGGFGGARCHAVG